MTGLLAAELPTLHTGRATWVVSLIGYVVVAAVLAGVLMRLRDV